MCRWTSTNVYISRIRFAEEFSSKVSVEGRVVKKNKKVVGLKKYRNDAAKETNNWSRPVDLADLSVCEEEDFPLCVLEDLQEFDVDKELERNCRDAV